MTHPKRKGWSSNHWCSVVSTRCLVSWRVSSGFGSRFSIGIMLSNSPRELQKLQCLLSKSRVQPGHSLRTLNMIIVFEQRVLSISTKNIFPTSFPGSGPRSTLNTEGGHIGNSQPEEFSIDREKPDVKGNPTHGRWMIGIFSTRGATPRKINMEPENTLLEEENNSSKPSFSDSMLNLRGCIHEFYYHQAGKKHSNIRLNMWRSFPMGVTYPPKNPTCQQFIPKKLLKMAHVHAEKSKVDRSSPLKSLDDRGMKLCQPGHSLDSWGSMLRVRWGGAMIASVPAPITLNDTMNQSRT